VTKEAYVILEIIFNSEAKTRQSLLTRSKASHFRCSRLTESKGMCHDS